MQTVSRSNFTTVTTEGAILPADLLQRIADGRELPGLRPEDYHLAPNERLNEAVSRSWNRLLGVWESFEEQRRNLPADDRGTTLTRERWLLILFQELGYGRLPFQGTLALAGQDDESARYPISHEYDRVPIHLVTLRQSLDRADEDRSERFRRSPHSLVQEFLNRSDRHWWGIVANGLRLRLLRDNVSFTRAAYLEFDLEAMMAGELYADFSLLWLTVHQSRLEGAPESCWLEQWSREAAEQGTRALDSLRDGVQEAIASLGRGFLAHPANGDLRQQLQSGELNTQDYYRQLLRLVYRLIFLFVAEDRNLLLVKEAGADMRQQYYSYYSVTRLRELAARRRSGPHPDLYRSLRLVMALLRQGYPPLGLPGLGSYLFSERSTPDLDAAEIANEALLDAIRALAFTVENRVLRPVDYKNLGAEELGSVYESLLELHPELNVAAATFDLRTAAGSERKTTGSYYTPTSLINSLLDTALEPVVRDRTQMNADTSQINADQSQKNQRESASDQRHLRSIQEEAILAIKVVDPACGSGHFLIAAANRLARHLARVRTGDEEPSPEANRLALRDVVRHCIHGVDINEMAVELCKVALWMETLDPGRPLSFLDAKIQCGNSLIGATPALLEKGIPDEAFTPITGDDKAYCREWKKRNRQEREGQQPLFTGDFQPWDQLGNLAAALMRLEAAPDETAADVEQQRLSYEALVQSTDYEFGKQWADAWCAAFVWEKRPEEWHADDADKAQINADQKNQRESATNQRRQRPISGWAQPLTDAIFRKLGRNPFSEKGYWQEIRRLAAQYQFFHWHLAFPQVFTPEGWDADDADKARINADPKTSDKNQRESASTLRHQRPISGWQGGFDVVLGNPPWERIKLQEKEWFASRDEAIATARNAAARRRLIAQLPKTNPALHEAFAADKRKAEGDSHFVRNSGKYPLCGRGDVNTYTIFAELARQVQNDSGRVGIIVPSGIATDDTTKYYFQDIMDSAALVSLYDFENRAGLFPAVDSRMKFCLLTLTGADRPATEGAQFVFFAQDVADLRDEERHFTLSAADIALLNPNTRTCPIFRSKQDAELTKAIYERVPVLIKEGPPEENPWGISFLRMFDMSNDSRLFRTREQLEAEGSRLVGNQFVRDVVREDVMREEVYLPLYEAKMLHHFDHRWATYEGLGTRDVTPAEKNDPTCLVLPRYWVGEEEVNGKLKARWSHEWLLAWRDITNSTNERTLISSYFSRLGCGDTVLLMLPSNEHKDVNTLISSSLDSFAADYATRQKIGGTHLKYHVFKQLPVLPPQTYHQPCPWDASRITYHAFLLPRVLELTYTAYDLRPFAQDCGYHGPPFRWDETQPSSVARRFLLRCELDAAYFHLYGIERDDVAYIMDTFPIIRRKDEAEYGEYRTKRVSLEIYDEMAEAMQGSGGAEVQRSGGAGVQGSGYRTRLEPAPGHPDAAHPWDEAYLGPELPRDQWWQEDRTQINADAAQIDTDEAKSEKNQRESAPDRRHQRAIKEPASTFELKSRPVEESRPGMGMADRPGQPALIRGFAPPQGGRSQRLKQVMALGDRVKANREDAAAISGLAAALGDSDDSIRWLAGSALKILSGHLVVATLAAFLERDPGEVGHREATKVLNLIADSDEDEAVRETARKLLSQ